jgi:Cu2+-containing amine oxidase
MEKTETAMPRNSINTPIDRTEELEYFKKENERVRENNMNLKLQLIESRKKLKTILEIINKEQDG